MKLTKKKIKALIKEEKSASKMYRKYGLKKIAKQEAQHFKFLSKKLRR